MKCSKCNGTGIVAKNTPIYIDKRLIAKSNMCMKCLGEGKLDWIENLVGKKDINQNLIFEHSSTKITPLDKW